MTFIAPQAVRVIVCVWTPNGLGFSGGAPREREGGRTDSRFQNADDLVAAKRRRLQALVGPLARKAIKAYAS